MRVVRVNELLKREVSAILHTRYRDSAVRITVSGVETSPDLKAATVFYGVIGDHPEVIAAKRFFSKSGEDIRLELGRRVILKYLPHLTFQYDESMERGSHIVDLIDSLEIEREGDPEKSDQP
ncbi:MAG TPA: 30S ribosome-binding factor RbfA [Opitutales bacterium]|nr:30S ribosome-binding factor RbfA [Opitutales bacterium]